jgi:hypothetical protein
MALAPRVRRELLLVLDDFEDAQAELEDENESWIPRRRREMVDKEEDEDELEEELVPSEVYEHSAVEILSAAEKKGVDSVQAAYAQAYATLALVSVVRELSELLSAGDDED